MRLPWESRKRIQSIIFEKEQWKKYLKLWKRENGGSEREKQDALKAEKNSKAMFTPLSEYLEVIFPKVSDW